MLEQIISAAEVKKVQVSRTSIFGNKRFFVEVCNSNTLRENLQFTTFKRQKLLIIPELQKSYKKLIYPIWLTLG